jgi:hypothetical protein
MAIGKGTGTTVVFSGGSTWAGTVRSLDIGETSVPVIDKTHLATTGFRELIAGSLKAPQPITMTVFFDPAVPPPAAGTAATCTIAFAGGANTLTGTGFFQAVSIAVENEEMMEATVVFQLDGATDPAYT